MSTCVSWYNMVKDTDQGSVTVEGTYIQIGRGPKNDIVLDNPSIAGHALVLEAVESGWQIVVLDGNSVEIGTREVFRGESCPVSAEEQIRLFPYTLTLKLDKGAQKGGLTRNRLDESLSLFIRRLHVDLIEKHERLLETIYGHLDSQDRENNIEEWKKGLSQKIADLETDLDTLAERNGLLEKGNLSLLDHLAGSAMRDELLAAVMRTSDRPGAVPEAEGRAFWSATRTRLPARETELEQLLAHFRSKLNLARIVDTGDQIDRIDRDYWPLWESLGTRIHHDFRRYLAQRYLKQQIKDILFGYGPLEDLLRIPSISEIMVVNSDLIYVERNGVLELTGRRFVSDSVTESIMSRIVGRVNRRIDRSQPLVDARLTDGSRVNAVISPIAVSGPCLTIRKFPLHKLSIDDLVRKGALTRTLAKFLEACVINRCNILVSGGTGTGKTTLLNCLSDFIPDNERIVTVEDTAELRLHKLHVVRLESKLANVEGAGSYTIRDLVKNALRMRPDRIVVGECRAGEALDMLQAMNTGHDGSLTTIHANNSEDVILRLEVLVQMAADLPILSIHRQIASAIDLIVQLKRFSSGRRCISQVTEVVGMDPDGDGLELRDLFVLDEDAGPGDPVRPTGHLPTFMPKLLEKNLLDLQAFYFEEESGKIQA